LGHPEKLTVELSLDALLDVAEDLLRRRRA